MDGARPVFLERGYVTACMDDVAARAGVSKATVYQHFGSKEAVFEAVIIAEADGIFDALPQSLTVEQGEAEELICVIRQSVLAALRAPRAQACLRLVVGSTLVAPGITRTFVERAFEPVIKALAARLEAMDPCTRMTVGDRRAAADRVVFDCLGEALVDLLVSRDASHHAVTTTEINLRADR